MNRRRPECRDEFADECRLQSVGGTKIRIKE